MTRHGYKATSRSKLAQERSVTRRGDVRIPTLLLQFGDDGTIGDCSPTLTKEHDHGEPPQGFVRAKKIRLTAVCFDRFLEEKVVT
jgi:hypothetical protein